MFSLYPIGQDANGVGAGLAPALYEGDRKGRPYTFRVRINIWSFDFAHLLNESIIKMYPDGREPLFSLLPGWLKAEDIGVRVNLTQHGLGAYVFC